MMNAKAVTLTPDKHPWINDTGLIAIKAAINAAGGELRPVGGCVRDALIGRTVKDIDCATTLDPDQVMRALENKGIRFVPTGIDHGTITAVFGGNGYEITTLRRDITTDGRRAVVAYTDDWREDAARRDFTFNAMSLNDEGAVVDYFGGLDDLKTRTIRFIGNPVQRIREDYLRILRALRFLSQLSEQGAEATIDPASFSACKVEVAGIAGLSVQRIAKELLLFLGGLSGVMPVDLLVESGVMGYIPYMGQNTEFLKQLVKWEISHHYGIDPLRRLAALSVDEEIPSNALMLSNKDYATLKSLLRLSQLLTAGLDRLALRQILYDEGGNKVRSAYALTAVRKSGFDMDQFLSVLESWEKPRFPLTGKDLLDHGIPSGPDMGQRLRRAEAWWRKSDFQPSYLACLERALADPNAH